MWPLVFQLFPCPFSVVFVVHVQLALSNYTGSIVLTKLRSFCTFRPPSLQVSVDWMEEQITNLEDYVQSVDVAAFQKI